MPATMLAPESFQEAAEELAAASSTGASVRIRGGATKLGWGVPAEETEIELCTARLDRIIEHNVGDLTAVVQAGAPFGRVREQLGSAGQMLALDPPLGNPDPDATLGGVIAAADSGPLRHRYGGPRDLVLGMTVALSDGTVARSGGKVIKNVAGYDLAKLFTGSLGTLGLILSVSVRLHPLPTTTATALAASSDPVVVGDAARALAAAPLELDALDVAWRAGRGGLLARCGGAEAVSRAERVAQLMRECSLEQVEVEAQDAGLWARQRAGQRSRGGALVRVAARPSRLPAVLRAVDAAGGTLVGRAGLGIAYVELDPESIGRLRGELGPEVVAVVLDAPAATRGALDPWGPPTGAIALMKQVKHRFDPAGICNPGIFVGGI